MCSIKSILRFPYSLKDYFSYRHWYNVVLHPIQRAKRGYADCDVWSLDEYLCKVIKNSVEQLKKNTHSYPMGITKEKWDKILQDIIL